eukprot:TRINITY_DN5538_c0_g1_i6.p1 TRINITY_DN5538_c0_g1~~TRINITY_DN5538_c0_g1_i6.p1  ORF type:complete len:144 (-),score=32.80 TRINITY_DN5538_c0_g1_i6:139-570(-)
MLKKMKTSCFLLLIFCLVYADYTKKGKGRIRIYKQGLTKAERDTTISAAIGDRFAIELVSNPSTGYSWYLQDYKSLSILSTNCTKGYGLYIEPEVSSKIMGAAGKERFFFTAQEAGSEKLCFLYKREWEKTFIDRYEVLVISK